MLRYIFIFDPAIYSTIFQLEFWLLLTLSFNTKGAVSQEVMWKENPIQAPPLASLLPPATRHCWKDGEVHCLCVDDE